MLNGENIRKNISGPSGTPKGLKKREQIVDFAFELISRRGIGALTFEIIASRLKISKTHVKYYFNSKEDLLLACFKQVAETGQRETEKAVEKAHTWQERVGAVVEGAFKAAEENPGHVSLLFLFYHYCTVNKDLARAQREAREIGRRRIRDMLIAGKKMNARDADQVAFEIQMCLTGALLEVANTQSFDKISNFRKRMDLFIKSVI